ncbi:hypothetical protein ACTXT7_003487 [Hymenolepis weldensis]
MLRKLLLYRQTDRRAFDEQSDKIDRQLVFHDTLEQDSFSSFSLLSLVGLFPILLTHCPLPSTSSLLDSALD